MNQIFVTTKSTAINLDGAPDWYNAPDFTELSEPSFPVVSLVELKKIPDPYNRVTDLSYLYRVLLPVSFALSLVAFALGSLPLFLVFTITYLLTLILLGLIIYRHFMRQGITISSLIIQFKGSLSQSEAAEAAIPSI